MIGVVCARTCALCVCARYVYDALDVAELCIDLLKFPFRRIVALSAAVNSFATGGGEGASHVDVPSTTPVVNMLREA